MSSELFGKLETEVEINAPAAKYHELFTRRPHHLSNISPDKIQSCELLEGQWGDLGSVIYWNYCYDGKTTVSTDLIEAVDDEKNSVTFKVIDGPLLEHYKSFRLIVEATPKGDRNSLVHLIVEYEKLHDQVSDPHSLLQFVADLSKDMGAHLSTQP
ncbi:putative START-like domain-containing protein [Rosa chinensis]|uniref:Putative START-like domain-containing protein n=1 Tax=Rosa chinensis TaxID=74649 RepID=A0A2P6PMV6_ROSCH|nr:MLP-like protein 43 [Rosa chinensis]PRQ23264.1 putative START-like domain-containing protein [Rosa chinensis]